MTTKLVLLAILAIALLFAGCASSPPTASAPVAPAPSGTAPPGAASVFKIGLISPMTGSVANFGPDYQKAAQMAAAEVNAAGGVNGQNVQLVMEDTGCDPAKAVPALNKMISADHINALVGGLCSGETLAMAPIFNQNQIVAISPGATNPTLSTKGGAYFFRMSPSDSFQGKMMAGYVYNKLHAKKVAILYENNDWGVGIHDVFKTSFAADGGQIVGEDSFESGVTDMRTEITKLLSAKPDAVYLPCYPAECAVALRQLHEAGFTGNVVGADAADDEKTLQTVNDSAEGFIWSVPSGGTDDFNAKFAAASGHQPVAYAAQAYDAVHLVALAASNSTDGPSMRDYLHALSNYTGATGAISFDAHGDRTLASYDIKTFHNGHMQLVEKVAG